MNRDVFRMKPLYDVLLRGSETMGIGLYQLYLATPEQLTRLHYKPGVLKAVKRRLKVLADNGYVQTKAFAVKHQTSEKTFYSARYYYSLTPLALRYLDGLGLDTREAWPTTRADDEHGLFVAHALELNDVLISAALLSRADPRFYLSSFTHERVLKRRPYRVQLDDGQSVTLIPDAYLDFRMTGSKLQLPVLLEHDRGTEEQTHFKRKVRAYVSLIKSGAYRELFGAHAVTVAFTTFTGEQRLEQMRTWTRQVLEASAEPVRIGSAFCFASLTQPLQPGTAWLEPRWYSPYDDGQAQPLLAA